MQAFIQVLHEKKKENLYTSTGKILRGLSY